MNPSMYQRADRSYAILSFGGGRNRLAALVLATHHTNDYHTFVFANTGEDSEHPNTLHYYHEIALPFAKQHGINFVMLQKRNHCREPITLLQRILDPS